MSFKENKITLLNYNPFTVLIPTETRTYILDPCYDYNIPTLINVSFSDVEYMNSHSEIFRNGMVFFKKEQQEEVYKELSIFDWENILTNKEIENILLNPTMDGLQKLLNIKDDPTFGRIYSVLVRLKNSNTYDLSSRVIKVIEARQKELHRGTLKTNIMLQERVTKPVNVTEDVDSLKEQNKTMAEQLANMQKMMAELLEKKTDSSEKKVVEVAEDKPNKKAGRPPKATK